ncbi:MAG: hypothetical protein RXO36_07225, partial [Candidatus Nanopusillus acidilobi]
MVALDRSQELEAILNGRSVMDLTGSEEVSLINTLTEIMEEKPVKDFTKVEFQALVEELATIFVANLFNGDFPKDWAKRALKWIDKHPKQEEGWNITAILGIHLHGIGLWENLTFREKRTVSRAI